MENIYDKPEMRELIEKGVVEPLDNLFLVDSVAMNIQEMDKKLDFYKEYKKQKNQDINNAINALDARKDFLRKVIISTLEKFQEKSVTFPGNCTITSRKEGNKWIIDDEEALIEFLKTEKELAKCAEKITQYKIIKKEVNKLLDICDKKDAVPSCVTKKEGQTSIAITYVKTEKEQIDNEKVPSKIKLSTPQDNYDGLDFS